MKKIWLFAFGLFAVCSLSAGVIYRENFDDEKNCTITGASFERVAGAGKCICLKPNSSASNGDATTSKDKLIPVRPGGWYRITLRERNTIGNGEIKYGFRESRSAEKLVSDYYMVQWRGLPLNITEWNTYTGEFQVSTETQAIRFQIHTSRENVGESWWDDIVIEEFTPAVPPLEIEKFMAVATYTDIDTKRAYRHCRGDWSKGGDRLNKTDYYWEVLDLNETMKVTYRNAQPGDSLVGQVVRGNKAVFNQTKEIVGNGKAEFDIQVGKLPEGVYVFVAALVRGNKTIFTVSKEIWRIDHSTCVTPRHEDIRVSSTGPNRQRLINGRIYHLSYASQGPASGLYEHHLKSLKPDFATYLKDYQEQYGIDTVPVWHWRASKWDDKPIEWLEKEQLPYTRKWLDDLHKNNIYGKVGFMVALQSGQQHRPSDEELTVMVRGLKDHPALLEWVFDEPEIARLDPEYMIHLYTVIKKEDPNHNVDINLCDPYRFHTYAPCSDVGSFDVYPFPNMDLNENFSRFTALVKAFPTAPVDSYLQMFNFNELPMPTFNQLRATFVMDRIFGSHSLVAYAWGEYRKGFLTDMELQGYYRAINKMFRELERYLETAEDCILPITTTIPYIRYRAFKRGSEIVVLMVNTSLDKVGTIEIKADAKTGENFFDSAWKMPKTNGVYSFELKGNDSFVLRLK